jgi:hypothetical protein
VSIYFVITFFIFHTQFSTPKRSPNAATNVTFGWSSAPTPALNVTTNAPSLAYEDQDPGDSYDTDQEDDFNDNDDADRLAKAVDAKNKLFISGPY